ncbi:hemerythrin domain-containing protein [Sinomonas halotolerans]|uniref:Hemerythrin domain-containing protein n=1 Tax=Sinomonas halotolerans TaxID=1644133 RepID=A0ABU9WV35_9MICC
MGHTHSDDDEALASIERHHSHMLERATALSDALIAAVDAGDVNTAYDEKANLVSWCEDELIPHALAEEGPLYGGARGTPEGRLLVEGMLQDHQAIVGLVDELRAADGAHAAALGLAVTRAFRLHLQKENRLLFPFIAGREDLSLADSVAGLEQIVGP